MTPDIVAVLVVPADGDPGGLVRAGAPVYHLVDDLEGWVVDGESGARVHAPTEGDGDQHTLDDGWALLLWWDGALAPGGWDRARRVLVQPRRTVQPETGWLHDFHPVRNRVAAIGDALVRTGLACRVVRLARVDGRLVEVEP